ncbi:MAG: DUF6472 family protein [Eubacterium sp.]|nr:DUF6472 family protein [Eubacterium sp.]
MAALCDECWYNSFDEESGEYFCDLQLDEDEYAKLLSNPEKGKSCKYFRPDIGEYGIVRKQN